jgi:hypothetical protein
MRPSVHGKIIRCHANEALVAAAIRTAEQESMTLSELMRDAIRQRVGQRSIAEMVQ